MRRLLSCAIIAAFGLAIPRTEARAATSFELHHGAGTLHIPTWNPLTRSSAPLKWSDGCGNSSRICATGKAGQHLFYILGGTLSPQDAKSKLECEAGAVASASGDQCLLRSGTTTTWTRKFGSVAVSISVDSTAHSSAAQLDQWFSEIRWKSEK